MSNDASPVLLASVNFVLIMVNRHLRWETEEKSSYFIARKTQGLAQNSSACSVRWPSTQLIDMKTRNVPAQHRIPWLFPQTLIWDFAARGSLRILGFQEKLLVVRAGLRVRAACGLTPHSCRQPWQAAARLCLPGPWDLSAGSPQNVCQGVEECRAPAGCLLRLLAASGSGASEQNHRFSGERNDLSFSTFVTLSVFLLSLHILWTVTAARNLICCCTTGSITWFCNV